MSRSEFVGRRLLAKGRAAESGGRVASVNDSNRTTTASSLRLTFERLAVRVTRVGTVITTCKALSAAAAAL